MQQNIKNLSSGTLEEINDILVWVAEEFKIENGRKTRTDCTGVETNIHKPTDSSLLWDCVRVLTRHLERIKETFTGLSVQFTDHKKRAKRRSLAITYPRTKKDKQRQLVALYKDLLKVSRKTYGYGIKTREVLKRYEPRALPESLLKENCLKELDEILDAMNQVMDQTERRVIKGEKVPVSEKLFSIFEKHTNIIVKGDREVLFGHKVCLTGGPSGLIQDCVVELGNPADASLVPGVIQRLTAIYGRPPHQASFDGGFASKENVKTAKELGVKDVAFHKKRGLKITDMVKSLWVFQRLKHFRAGIEGCISTLKRAFQMDRCNWCGLESFKAYVWSCVISFNLIVIARHLLN